MELILSNKIEELLESYDFQNRILMNNLGIIDPNYKYTCISIGEFDTMVESIKKDYRQQGSNISELVIRAKLTDYLALKCKPYFNMIYKSIQTLDKHPFIEQKTQEWLTFRKKIITGTEAEKIVLKTETDEKNNVKLFDIAKSKIDLKEIFNLPNYISKGFSGAAMTHGNTYEDVSLAIYSSRYQVKVKEYGIIKSELNPIIGASPDGVVIETNPNIYDSFRRRGRLVEVKNPFSRVIDDTISERYQFQMLQQQFSCCIPICDFLETTIVDADCHTYTIPPYKNMNDMLRDVMDTNQPNWKSLIKNTNIPYQNLSSYGKEKGYLIRFYRFRNNNPNDEEFLSVMYPLDSVYTRDAIIKWKKETIETMAQKGFKVKTYKYWRLDVLDVKEFIYDADKYQNKIVPELEKNWKKINNYKLGIIELLLKVKDNINLQDNQYLNNYLGKITYKTYNNMCIENNIDIHNTTYLNDNNLSHSETNKGRIDINIDNYL
jgi:hypothetical protein